MNLISAISPRGQLRFMYFEGSFTIPVYVDFVKRLMLTANASVFLIADRHPVHRCKAIRQVAAESNGRLCLFFLPAYSPDLNPDELVRVISNITGSASLPSTVRSISSSVSEQFCARCRRFRPWSDPCFNIRQSATRLDPCPVTLFRLNNIGETTPP
ncbi:MULTISPECIES: transposase [Paraburkholderia]|uniref:transposase n=1 Tax=Paraburkholderia TaxID=1822464 RepID=UPI0013A6A752|nr:MULTISPECIES: transposase [Paraburkholderia]MDH6152561.1 transposase [Paraburkholderia sp. WSM4179]